MQILNIESDLYMNRSFRLSTALDVDDLLLECVPYAVRLANEKYAQWEWIYGRSPRATLSHSARLSCGMVDIHLTLSENRIATCCFGGDFIGNLPVSEVESAIKGMPYDMSLIRECLSRFDIGEYFDGVNVDDLMSIFK